MDGTSDRQPLDRAKRVRLIREASTNDVAIRLVCDVYGILNVTVRLATAELGLFDVPYLRTTYSPEWVTQQLTAGYIRQDQVVVAGFTSDKAFFWSDLERTAGWERILEDAFKAGVGPEGYSIPVIDPNGRRSLTSLNTDRPVREWRSFIEAHESELHEVARILHDRAVSEAGFDDKMRLGQRELECLHWVSRGKEAGDIAAILEISEHTVRSYLKSAKLKLDCRTLSQAVGKAISLGLIRLSAP